MPDDTRLSPKQQRALAALLRGQTMTAAAEAAGVNPKTLYLWRQDVHFRAELQAGERELVAGALRALETLARPAVVLLGRVVLDDEARPGDRLRAASTILDNVLKLKEILDLEERVTALEAQAREGGGHDAT
jgi:transposase-like protein